MKRNKNIKEMIDIEKPIEKLQKYGSEKLSDEELLAIVLRTGRKGKNAISLSKDILKKFGSDLPTISTNNIQLIPGIGKVKASQIVALFELGRRFLKDKQNKLVADPEDIWHEMRDLRTSRREHFVVFFLDAKDQSIHREIISIGSQTKSVVHPREVFETAIRYSAVSVILAHNHPSGSVEVSEEDIQLTTRLAIAGEILGILVADHIIVTKDRYRSIMRE